MSRRGFFALIPLASAVAVFLSSCQAQTVLPNKPAVSQSQSEATAIATTVAQPTITPTPEVNDWQETPVIPETLSNRAKEIYANGLAFGRDPRVFSKVGDCGGTPSWFLGPFDIGPSDYRLGEYQYLEEVITYFQGSYGRDSLAVRDGFNAAAILSPIRASRVDCQQGEDPLACEFRINNPSIALIMVGTNDVYHVDKFEGRLRQIIEHTIDLGILPVLASKPDNLEGDHSIIRIIHQLALEYELPYWNLWQALQGLPEKGLQDDGAHMTFAPNYFDSEFVMQSGWPHRNLTALQVLDFLRQELDE